MDLPHRYCVVGAGPSGLIAARALLRYGIEVDVLERHGAVGGIWDIDNPGSPLYTTCNFITSRHGGAFIGYPMAGDVPDYPLWWQVRDYVRSFARDHGLDEHIELGAEVVDARPVHDARGDWWRVTLGDGDEREYRGVVWACGQQWFPNMPELPGAAEFDGEVIHSRDYTSPDQLRGRRVLVIGAGNSGVDIACDAAAHAERAWLSLRRGYWFFPKQLFGLPVPDLLTGAIAPPADPALPEGLTGEAIGAFVLAVVGDPTLYGLPAPDHPVAATHPIVNDQVLHHLSHGLLEAKPDVRRLTADGVEFADGTEAACDLVICATGYDIRIPWLPDGLVEYRDGHPVFHLGTFASGVPGLYAVGVLHFADNAFPVFDQLAQLMAADAHATLTGENAESLRRLKAEFDPDLRGGYPFVETRRNALQVHVPALREALTQARDAYGIPMPEPGDDGFYASLLDRRAAGAGAG